MGAGGEGVAEAPVGRVGNVSDAGVADLGVGRNLCPHAAFAAGDDAEIRRQIAGEGLAFHGFDMGQWRGLVLETAAQFGDGVPRSGDADQHAFGVIEHFAGKAEGFRASPYEGPKADALHPAAHPDLDFFSCGNRVHSLKPALEKCEILRD